MVLAMSSFPVPVSPKISTVEGELEIVGNISNIFLHLEGSGNQISHPIFRGKF